MKYIIFIIAICFLSVGIGVACDRSKKEKLQQQEDKNEQSFDVKKASAACAKNGNRLLPFRDDTHIYWHCFKKDLFVDYEKK